MVACAKVADGVRVDHGSDGTYAARDCAMSAKVATDKVEDLIFMDLCVGCLRVLVV